MFTKNRYVQSLSRPFSCLLLDASSAQADGQTALQIQGSRQTNCVQTDPFLFMTFWDIYVTRSQGTKWALNQRKGKNLLWPECWINCFCFRLRGRGGGRRGTSWSPYLFTQFPSLVDVVSSVHLMHLLVSSPLRQVPIKGKFISSDVCSSSPDSATEEYLMRKAHQTHVV